MDIFEIIVLSLSGLALIYASAMRLINPSKANFLQTYLANATNKLEDDSDLLNEIRGIGAVMFLGGLTILIVTIIPNFRQTGFVVATVILFGVVVGRLISIRLDGKPNQAILKAMTAEVLLSVLNIFCLVNNIVFVV